MQVFLKIFTDFKYIKKIFFIYIILGFILQSIFVVFPRIIEKVVSYIEAKNLDLFYEWCYVFGIVAIIVVILDALYGYIGAALWHKLKVKISKNYREKFLSINYDNVMSAGTGKMIAKFQRGIEAEADIFLAMLQMIIDTIYRGVLIIIVFFFVFPLFAYIFLGAVLFIFTINYFLYRYIQPLTKKLNDVNEEEKRDVARLIMEFLTIKIYNKRKKELEKGYDTLDKLPPLEIKTDIYNHILYDIMHLIVRGVEFLVYLIIGFLVIKGDYSLSFLIMITTYVWFIWWPIHRAIGEINRINRSLEAYHKLHSFLDKPQSVINGDKKFEYKSGKIEFENLCFDYGTKKVFEDFGLDFLAGKKNALVGHSGSGKSTIVKLLLRLYDIQSGKILVDGQDIRELDIYSLYDYIGYLPQEPGVFDGTIRQNMEYALGDNVDSTKIDDEIWEALKKAQIDDMIRGLDKGLDTEVGERGVKLSGGEKQRLAIARVFLKNPKILILDEPTSALDSVSEAKITNILTEVMKDKTVIVIAHRLQTVMKAQKIVVLENGKVMSEGTHSELLEKSDIYKELVDLQNGKILD